MNKEIERLLNENGVDRVKFYYTSTPLVDNAYTTCVFINTEKGRIESRGVAICSLRDTFSKSKGKNKSFGRAMSAIHRKMSSEKINPCGRDCEGVRRVIKIKSDKDADRFEGAVAELHNLDPDLEVAVVEGNGKTHSKYCFSIPASYPIRIANKDFKYKSQFRPNPAGSEEAQFLNSLKEEKAI